MVLGVITVYFKGVAVKDDSKVILKIWFGHGKQLSL
jgi:hypothetical protein